MIRALRSIEAALFPSRLASLRVLLVAFLAFNAVVRLALTAFNWRAARINPGSSSSRICADGDAQARYSQIVRREIFPRGAGIPALPSQMLHRALAYASATERIAAAVSAD